MFKNQALPQYHTLFPLKDQETEISICTSICTSDLSSDFHHQESLKFGKTMRFTRIR